MKPIEKKEFKDFPKCPEGQHIARLCGIIDMGTQETVFEGVVSKKAQIYLQFEVFAEDEDGKEVRDDFGNPFLIGQVFTASLSPKGKLLPFINAWRGKPLEDKDFPFDFSRMLGRFCLMTVVINHDKKDAARTYANINGVSPVPKKMAQDPNGDSILPAPVADQFFFNLDDQDWGAMLKIYDKKLWEGMKIKISKAPEFIYRNTGKQESLSAKVDDDGEIPF
jgi:hypothetical protein